MSNNSERDWHHDWIYSVCWILNASTIWFKDQNNWFVNCIFGVVWSGVCLHGVGIYRQSSVVYNFRRKLFEPSNWTQINFDANGSWGNKEVCRIKQYLGLIRKWFAIWSKLVGTKPSRKWLNEKKNADGHKYNWWLGSYKPHGNKCWTSVAINWILCSNKIIYISVCCV